MPDSPLEAAAFPALGPGDAHPVTRENGLPGDARPDVPDQSLALAFGWL